MTDISRDALKDIVDRVLLDANSPHINLGPILGVSAPVKVGLDDMISLLQSGEPAFKIEVGDSSLTVRRQDGGMMATIEIAW